MRYEHPDDFESDIRPYCGMRATAEASNQSCGLIDWDDELMDYPEVYDFPISRELHLISIAVEVAISNPISVCDDDSVPF